MCLHVLCICFYIKYTQMRSYQTHCFAFLFPSKIIVEFLPYPHTQTYLIVFRAHCMDIHYDNLLKQSSTDEYSCCF